MRKLIFIFALLLLAGQVWGDTTFIEITALPHQISSHSAATWDCYSLADDSGGVLHSDSFGIYFSLLQAANDYILFDFSGDDGIPMTADDDSIVFGMDKTANAVYSACGVSFGSFGISTGAAATRPADSMKIRGGYIISAPAGITCSTDYAVEGQAAINHHCIQAVCGGVDGFVMDSVTMVVRGYADSYGSTSGSRCIWVRGKGAVFNGCRLINRTYAMGYRGNFYSTGLTYYNGGAGVNPTLEVQDDYHVRMESCYVDITGHTGVDFYAPPGSGGPAVTPGFFQIEGCTVLVDNHNSRLDQGYTNGYGVRFGGVCNDGTDSGYCKGNTFLSGTTFAGGRGMEIRQCNYLSDDTKYTDTVRIYDNYFDNHAGFDSSGEFSYHTFTAMNVKYRKGNHYTNFYDNVCKLTIDSADSHPESNYHPVGVNLNVQIEMDPDHDIRKPYHLTIENNYCSLFVRADSAARPDHMIYGMAMNLSGMPDAWKNDLDTTIKIKNNTFYSQGGTVIMFGSQWDASCQDVIFGPGNILSLDADSGYNKGTITTCGYGGNYNIEIYNNTYADDATDMDVTWWSKGAATGYWGIIDGSDPWWDITFERLYDVYVKGNNDLPVVNATVKMYDSLGTLLMNGISNDHGRASCTVSYRYYERDDMVYDTIDYNRCSTYAEVGADNDQNLVIVSWTTAGGTDTLYLANTAGTGTWLPGEEEEDTTRRNTIKGIKIKGVKISYEEAIDIYGPAFAGW